MLTHYELRNIGQLNKSRVSGFVCLAWRCPEGAAVKSREVGRSLVSKKTETWSCSSTESIWARCTRGLYYSVHLFKIASVLET